MGSRRVHRAARTLVATAVAGLVVGVTPATAQASTRYDGDATALRIEGLRLQLFPNGTAGLPPQLKPVVQAVKDLQAQAPKELQRDSLALAMPDQVIGHVTFPGTDTQGEIPDNPLLAADMLGARSVKAANGDLVSEASLSGLSLGGGVLQADMIKTSCRGTGDKVGLDVSQLRLTSNQGIVDNEITLTPGTAVPIEGLGTVTFNQQDTDGTTYAEGTNVVIALDSDLSLAALARVFDTTAPAMEKALKQVLLDLGNTSVGGQKPLQPALNPANVDKLSGQQLYDGVDQALDQLDQQAPPQLSEALNNVAHLGGTITVANAACSQATSAVAGPSAPNRAAPSLPAKPAAAPQQPPLADTGAPAGVVAAALAGLVALAGGGVALVRLRRRPA